MIAGAVGAAAAMLLVAFVRPSWPLTVVLAIGCGYIVGKLLP